MISCRRNKVIKHVPQWGTIRYGAISSSNSVNRIGTSRRARGCFREWTDGVLREDVRIGKTISTTGCQDRDECGVDLLVRGCWPVYRGVKITEKRC